MDSYNNSFFFESVYFIISALFIIIIIYWRLYFKSEKSRTILLFTTFPVSLLHYIVADHGISSLLNTFGSTRLFTFDESFIKNMAVIFLLLNIAITFNLFWRSNIRRFK